MSIAELDQKKTVTETNILAMGICLAQQERLLYLIRGCLANPSKGNLEILERAEKDHRDWLVRMASDRLPCPAPASTAKEE